MDFETEDWDLQDTKEDNITTTGNTEAWRTKYERDSKYFVWTWN